MAAIPPITLPAIVPALTAAPWVIPVKFCAEGVDELVDEDVAEEVDELVEEEEGVCVDESELRIDWRIEEVG